MLNEIINGKRAITPQIAIIIEKALQIKADFWLNMQSQYELDTERIKELTIKKLQKFEVWQIIKAYVPVKHFRKKEFLTGVQEKDIVLIRILIMLAKFILLIICYQRLIGNFQLFMKFTNHL